MEEDIPYIEMKLNFNAIFLLYNSVKYCCENFSDHPEYGDGELEELNHMKDLLYRIILDYKFEHM